MWQKRPVEPFLDEQPKGTYRIGLYRIGYFKLARIGNDSEVGRYVTCTDMCRDHYG